MALNKYESYMILTHPDIQSLTHAKIDPKSMTWPVIPVVFLDTTCDKY